MSWRNKSCQCSCFMLIVHHSPRPDDKPTFDAHGVIYAKPKVRPAIARSSPLSSPRNGTFSVITLVGRVVKCSSSLCLILLSPQPD